MYLNTKYNGNGQRQFFLLDDGIQGKLGPETQGQTARDRLLAPILLNVNNRPIFWHQSSDDTGAADVSVYSI